jgi:phospholipid-translocating ATPase
LLPWWITGIVTITAFLIFEFGVASVRKTFWPVDTDVFQELEKDKAMKRKFEIACRDVLGGTKGATEAEILEEEEKEEEEREKKRLEEEVSQLLHKRAMDAAALDTTVRK